MWFFFFRRSSRDYRRSEREHMVDMAEEPHVMPYGSPYYDSSNPTASAQNLYSSGGSGPASSGNLAYNPQQAFGAEGYSQATGAATAAGPSTLPPLVPLRLTKAQEAGLAPRDGGPSSLYPHTASAGVMSPGDGRASSYDAASSNGSSAPLRPSGSARRDSLTSSAAGTALTSSASPTEAVAGLRQEVQDLRRVMQQLQAERLEAPPQYYEG